jgi:hypothetical protein
MVQLRTIRIKKEVLIIDTLRNRRREIKNVLGRKRDWKKANRLTEH